MPSGLGRGVDKAIRDIEEELGITGEQLVPESGVTPEQEAKFREYVDRMMAVAITWHGCTVIPDEKLVLECHWWLIENGLWYAPGPEPVVERRSPSTIDLFYQNLEPGSFEEVIALSHAYQTHTWYEAQIKKIWHEEGPTVEEVRAAPSGVNFWINPSGRGILTKEALMAGLRLWADRIATLPKEYRDALQRSIDYWNAAGGEHFVMPAGAAGGSQS